VLPYIALKVGFVIYCFPFLPRCMECQRGQ